MTYTLRLIKLKCLQAQEYDGDELYLKYNGHIVWKAGYLKMHESVEGDHIAHEISFAEGIKRTRHGWSSLTEFNPSLSDFTAESGISHLELWEADSLLTGGDDYLGQTPISKADAEHGQITVAFQHDGAHYLLTYQVVVD